MLGQPVSRYVLYRTTGIDTVVTNIPSNLYLALPSKVITGELYTNTIETATLTTDGIIVKSIGFARFGEDTKSVVDTAGNIYGTEFFENDTSLASKYLLQAGGTITGTLTIGGKMSSINFLPGQDLRGHGDLANADLTGGIYHGSVFSGMNLGSVNFTNANLEGALFIGCTFDGAKFDGARMSNARFDSCEFGPSTMTNMKAERTSFANANLEEVTITGSNIMGADFTGASMPTTIGAVKATTTWDTFTKWIDGTSFGPTSSDDADFDIVTANHVTSDTLVAGAGTVTTLTAGTLSATTATATDMNVTDDLTVGDDMSVGGDATVTGSVIASVVQADTIIGTVLGDMEWNGTPAAYIMDGTDDFSTSAFTQSTQSVEMLVYPTVTNKALCTFGTNMGITFNSSNVIQYGSSFANVTTYVNGSAGTTLTLNKWNHIVAVFDAITPTVLEIGRSDSTYFTGRVWGFRPYNRPLTAAEVTQRWNNGAPHLYGLELVDRNAGAALVTGDNVTFASDTGFWTKLGTAAIGSGVATLTGNGTTGNSLYFTVNSALRFKRVRLTYTVTANTLSGGTVGERFRLAASGITTSAFNLAEATGQTYSYEIVISHTGSLFLQFNLAGTAASGAISIDNVTVDVVGCTAEYTAENAGAMGWIETMNGLHGSTSGTPIAPQSLRDYRATVSTTPVALTNTQKAQTILTRVILKNNNENTQTCSLGTSSGGTQLINAQSVAGGSEVVVSVNSYSATERTLYAVASAASFSITLIYEKVAL